MKKRIARTQPVECLDCKVVCSPDSLCRCCEAINADRDRDWD